MFKAFRYFFSFINRLSSFRHQVNAFLAIKKDTKIASKRSIVAAETKINGKIRNVHGIHVLASHKDNSKTEFHLMVATLNSRYRGEIKDAAHPISNEIHVCFEQYRAKWWWPNLSRLCVG